MARPRLSSPSSHTLLLAGLGRERLAGARARVGGHGGGRASLMLGARLNARVASPSSCAPGARMGPRARLAIGASGGARGPACIAHTARVLVVAAQNGGSAPCAGACFPPGAGLRRGPVRPTPRACHCDDAQPHEPITQPLLWRAPTRLAALVPPRRHRSCAHCAPDVQLPPVLQHRRDLVRLLGRAAFLVRLQQAGPPRNATRGRGGGTAATAKGGLRSGLRM